MLPISARSSIFTSAAAAALFGLALGGTGHAESVRSQCSAKYQAAKTANTLNGQSWKHFYHQCSAEAKGTEPSPSAAAPIAPPVAAAPPPSAAPAAEAPAAAPKRAAKRAAPAAPTESAPVATGPIVFPTAIAPQYSTLSAGQARRKTCGDQFRANEPTNSNGGLKWSVKGGGYYHECNNKLKGQS